MNPYEINTKYNSELFKRITIDSTDLIELNKK